jgi:hypothetical protein
MYWRLIYRLQQKSGLLEQGFEFALMASALETHSLVMIPEKLDSRHVEVRLTKVR